MLHNRRATVSLFVVALLAALSLIGVSLYLSPSSVPSIREPAGQLAGGSNDLCSCVIPQSLQDQIDNGDQIHQISNNCGEAPACAGTCAIYKFRPDYKNGINAPKNYPGDPFFDIREGGWALITVPCYFPGVCGNGVVEKSFGEECDPPGSPCSSDSCPSGSGTCSADCKCIDNCVVPQFE